MKAKMNCGNLQFELEADTQTELFKLIADTQEVFGETCCGKCKSKNIRYGVREVDGDEYYEMRCQDCSARLCFGQMKTRKGYLFPNRYITEDGRASRKEGTFDRENRGWAVYRGHRNEEGAKEEPAENNGKAVKKK